MQRTPEAQDRLTAGSVYACEKAYAAWRDQFGQMMPGDAEQLRIAFNSGYMAAMNNVLRATEPKPWWKKLL